MLCIVSKPFNVEVEILDEETECSYLYGGKCVKDCEEYFLSLFDKPHKYKIVWLNVR